MPFHSHCHHPSITYFTRTKSTTVLNLVSLAPLLLLQTTSHLLLYLYLSNLSSIYLFTYLFTYLIEIKPVKSLLCLKPSPDSKIQSKLSWVIPVPFSILSCTTLALFPVFQAHWPLQYSLDTCTFLPYLGLGHSLILHPNFCLFFFMSQVKCYFPREMLPFLTPLSEPHVPILSSPLHAK